MKVVHINASDVGGGSSIAAYRHCEAMSVAGVDSKLLVINRQRQSDLCGNLSYKNTLQKIIHKIGRRIYPYIHNYFRPKGEFGIWCYGMNLMDSPDVRNADVIFLHWLGSTVVSVKGLEKLLRSGKPVYWYMHDMFPITGGCHYSLDCNRYKTHCEKCPLIRGGKYPDWAAMQFQRKIEHWSKYPNLKFVTPSAWLGDCVRQSRIAQGHDVFVVPNVINTSLYRPLETECKSAFGLDPKKKTILFAAAHLGSIYKGSEYMHKALELLDPEKYEGLIVGHISDEFQKGLRLRIVSTGFLKEEERIVMAYNACDTFVIPSIAENYPNVVLETMACGKPSVGFPTGGIPDLIQHGVTGYLTSSKSAEELINGIEYLFADRDRYERLSKNCREFVMTHNSYERVLEIHNEINWKE